MRSGFLKRNNLFNNHLAISTIGIYIASTVVGAGVVHVLASFVLIVQAQTVPPHYAPIVIVKSGYENGIAAPVSVMWQSGDAWDRSVYGSSGCRGILAHSQRVTTSSDSLFSSTQFYGGKMGPYNYGTTACAPAWTCAAHMNELIVRSDPPEGYHYEMTLTRGGRVIFPRRQYTDNSITLSLVPYISPSTCVQGTGANVDYSQCEPIPPDADNIKVGWLANDAKYILEVLIVPDPLATPTLAPTESPIPSPTLTPPILCGGFPCPSESPIPTQTPAPTPTRGHMFPTQTPLLPLRTPTLAPTPTRGHMFPTQTPLLPLRTPSPDPQTECVEGVTKCTSDADCLGGICDISGICQTCCECLPLDDLTPDDPYTPGERTSPTEIPPPSPTPTHTPTPTGVQITVTGEPDPVPQSSISDLVNTEEQQRLVCLKAQPCSQSSSRCVDSMVDEHTMKLSADPNSPLAANDIVFIVDCLYSPEAEHGIACTIGDYPVDMDIGIPSSINGQFPEGERLGYVHGGMYSPSGRETSNPVGTDGDGQLDYGHVYWHSSTSTPVGHVFYGLTDREYTRSQNVRDPGRASVNQGSFEIGSRTTPDIQCVPVYWYDPYGRVFDSYTLEPLANTNVTLSRLHEGAWAIMGADAYSFEDFTNPLATGVDGKFAFGVPDGTYRLSVESPNYTFPADPTYAHPQTHTMYEDIYYGGNIIQKGMPEHRDVPLDPIDLTQSKQLREDTPVTIMQTSPLLNKETLFYTVNGVVSHPKATITLYGRNNTNRVLARAIANKKGRFTLALDMDILPQGETVGRIVAEKYPLTLSKRFAKHDPAGLQQTIAIVFDHIRAQAQSTGDTAVVPVILPYVEGTIYDNEGVPIPKAQVEVITDISTKPYATTQTNAQGFVRIDAHHVPGVPYHLRITWKNGGTFTKALHIFVRENESEY